MTQTEHLVKKAAGAAVAETPQANSEPTSNAPEQQQQQQFNDNRGARGKLYFAYGSNLSSTQMSQRCPHATAVGLARLDGWDWIINERRYANIVRAPTSDPSSSPEKQEHGLGVNDDPVDAGHHPGVYGVLYRLPPADEAALDACEGVPFAYNKLVLAVSELDPETLEEARRVEALAYVDLVHVLPRAPWPEYVGRMSAGVREARERWGFPVWYVEMVMRRFVPGLSW
ncbi:hypothetical protein BKA67DRAFT_557043 [Truncatella angustata]|uniref:gamma-glutamylcyclotransferase n=1 Tax=Truncatella angustata TaxID=152316 RepID=A0A9P9A2C4_9PEZI|nr:uncharacterized protein BKA67DRAFT_557043 [Truncatella angustata]KAH6658056.1 hypothetical protein BKA67DRAFT_557043 [Truncatella angustata]